MTYLLGRIAKCPYKSPKVVIELMHLASLRPTLIPSAVFSWDNE
jgi:hypothetical protein